MNSLTFCLSENSLSYLYSLKMFSLGIEFQFGNVFFQHFEGIIQWVVFGLSLSLYCCSFEGTLSFLTAFNSFSSYLILTSFTILFQVVKLFIYPDWASQGFLNLCVSIFPQLWLNLILLLLHLISLLLLEFQLHASSLLCTLSSVLSSLFFCSLFWTFSSKISSSSLIFSLTLKISC